MLRSGDLCPTRIAAVQRIVEKDAKALNEKVAYLVSVYVGFPGERSNGTADDLRRMVENGDFDENKTEFMNFVKEEHEVLVGRLLQALTDVQAANTNSDLSQGGSEPAGDISELEPKRTASPTVQTKGASKRPCPSTAGAGPEARSPIGKKKKGE